LELTEIQLDLLLRAWAVSVRGGGLVADEHIPELHPLAEEGWLERRLDGDELTWWWTAQAETALAVAKLTSVEGRQN
jgi:hypothetical protein